MKTKADKFSLSVTQCEKTPLIPISLLIVLCFIVLLCSPGLMASQLYIGKATVDITPEVPVALQGQFHLRITSEIETPLTANIITLETRDGNRSLDIAIMVSCDLALITEELSDMVKQEVKKLLPETDAEKIFLNATHTHTAPVYFNHPSFLYNIPETGVLQPDEYQNFMVKRIAGGIVEAWKSRQQGSMTWGLGHASVANNRRVVYSKKIDAPGTFADGTARMYGNTNTPDFINIEGMEDRDVHTLFFWDKNDKFIATIISIGCTAQEVEGRNAINADLFHPVREKLKKQYGQDLVILGWISAAGDQSPRPMYRKAAEERMMKLRNLTRLEELARRVVNAVDEIYETVKNDKYEDIKLIHQVETFTLPGRKVKPVEYEFAKSERDKYAKQIEEDPKSADQLLGRMTWNNDIVRRYEMQKTEPDPQYKAKIHILRIGDVAVCTNPFELFTDFGLRIRARSNALQTISLQLTDGSGGYLPTQKAVEGGGYSAVVQSGMVGPEGGQVLVDKSVELINKMF